MNRKADGSALLRNRTRDPLTDPLIHIGAELVAPCGIKFLHTPHQTNRSLLDQVQQFHVPLGVFRGDAHHKAQVRRHHPLLDAATRLQQLYPEARVVIVGEQEGVSYGKVAPGGSWKTVFLKELEGQIDLTRVHFTGSLAYAPFLQLLRITAAHVYLTYPFVLSWSLLEAMSSQAPVVGSATAPVQEVIRDGVNGLLVDFFAPDQLADAIDALLRDRPLAESLGVAACQMILNRYALNVCLPQQLSLMQLVAARALP
mgnify:CR=1 FL=1